MVDIRLKIKHVNKMLYRYAIGAYGPFFPDFSET
jgi:hypothetical protein